MDIPREVLEETQARFIQRDAERAESIKRLAKGGPLAAENADRLEARLARIGVPLPDAQEVVRGGAKIEAVSQQLSEETKFALERILKGEDLLPIAYLDKARLVARAVCRIVDDQRPIGTGWLCAPGIMITNNHVLSTQAAAKTATIEFDYELDIQQQPLSKKPFKLDPQKFFITHTSLDYTLVAVQGDASAFGWLPLFGSGDKHILGESLSIIQHPLGRYKHIALRENRLIDRLPDFLHYETDTEPGSSGSPVFNDSWEVVALHHSGVPKRNEQGQVLKRDGQPFESTDSADSIHWVANEGVRISRLIKELRSLPESQQSPLKEVLEAQRPPKQPAQKTETITQAGTVLDLGSIQVNADGQASWPVTLQVKVQSKSAPERPKRPGQPPYLDPADEAKAKAYYQQISPNVGGQALFKALSKLLEETHTTKPRYRPSRELYPLIDLWPDGRLRSVYTKSEHTVEEMIAADEAAQAARERLALQEGIQSDLLEEAFPYNCEHVVPQSWYRKREPMRGDLHHLFTCQPRCNSFRGNSPFFDFPDYEERIMSDCGKSESSGFEPSYGKGAVARATLYFLLRYPRMVRQYSPNRLKTLLAWHQNSPVIDWEKHRNMYIFARQGNRNPLIDHPEWADQIDFAEGLRD